MKPYLENIAQVPEEIDAFCQVLQSVGARSFLEIGSKYGGSLWAAANALPPGSKVVSVDLPKGTKAWAESKVSLEMCIRDLRLKGYDAEVIWGSSQSMDVIKKVLAKGPYDAIMIDADHRMPGVSADWDNYGHMANLVVAFHDIAWKRAPEWVGVRIDVPQFWNEIKDNHYHREFKFCPTGKNNGIGVLWK